MGTTGDDDVGKLLRSRFFDGVYSVCVWFAYVPAE